MKRTIGMGLAAAAVVAGVLGSAVPAAADTTILAQQFVCNEVTNRGGPTSTPSQWGKECNSNDQFTVVRGGKLCVAVLGSAGHGIVFRAYAGNAWVGRPSPPLVVGSQRYCIITNSPNKVTVHIKARSNTVFGVNVLANGTM